MDFELNEEQKLIGDSVARLLGQEADFETRRHTARTAEGFNRDLWGRLAELGVLALPFDEADGGFSGSGIDLLPVMQALGRALALEPFLGVVILAGAALRHGTAAQKAARLPGLMDGSRLFALAHYEPSGPRHTLDRIDTVAVRQDDGRWRLNGAKTAVLAGASANEWIVSARTDGGVSLFLVARETSGATVRPTRSFDDHAMSDLVLNDVIVGADAVLGSPDEGQEILRDVFERANVAVAAEAVGVMDEMVGTTVAYLKTRRQFGTPIGGFQALQHRAVEMSMQTELARSMAILAALALDMPAAARAANIAAAKVRIAEATRFVGEQAVQLHGAIGLTEELQVGHAFKRLTALSTLFGDSDHHLETVIATGGLTPLFA